MAAIFIVGAGRVGSSLAAALPAAGHRVVGTWSRRDGGELAAAPGLGEAEIVLVAVSDDAVAEVGRALAAARLAPGCVVAHTSGALPGAALGRGPFAQGSLHPLRALPHGRASLAGAVFAIEGDPPARPVLAALTTSLGGRPVELRAGSKARYHAAAVLASNLVVALLEVATAEAEAAGLQDAGAALAELAAGAVAQVQQLGIDAALTGPVARGDAGTVRTHLALLEGDAAAIYRLLSARAVEIAARRGLTPQAVEALRAALETSALG